MALEDLVQRVTIETALLPPVSMDYPLKGQGGSNPLLAILKPRITVTTPGGAYVSHPWGDPGATRWPLVRDVALLAGLAILGAIAYKALA